MRLSQHTSQKAIDPSSLSRLQEDIVQSLVSLEMIFPPSFFNIMTHLLVHLVKEIGILGPVFLHNMFPFERYFAVLKKYGPPLVDFGYKRFIPFAKKTKGINMRKTDGKFFIISCP